MHSSSQNFFRGKNSFLSFFKSIERVVFRNFESERLFDENSEMKPQIWKSFVRTVHELQCRKLREFFFEKKRTKVRVQKNHKKNLTNFLKKILRADFFWKSCQILTIYEKNIHWKIFLRKNFFQKIFQDFSSVEF